MKHVVATEPEYDCFYVYPTVVLSGPVGTVDEAILSNHAPMLDALLSQAARFTGQCRVFAPLYRQVTMPTYSDPLIDAYLEESYVDVAAAFDHFLKMIGDRPFVVMSHSQGSHLSRRLRQRKIDPDPALRARLIVGLLIGGDTMSDSYTNIPKCTAEDQVGCVISYRTFAEKYEPKSTKPLPPGQLCTNPASLAGGERRLGGTYFPTATNNPALGTWAKWPDSIKTPFVLLRNFYTSECVTQGQGSGDYLEIRVRPIPADTRVNPIPFGHIAFDPGKSALHALDYDFPLDDLMRLVAAKAAERLRF